MLESIQPIVGTQIDMYYEMVTILFPNYCKTTVYI